MGNSHPSLHTVTLTANSVSWKDLIRRGHGTTSWLRVAAMQ